MSRDLEEVISTERLKKLMETNSIYVSKIDNKIVGYIIFEIKEKDNSFMRYRKLLSIDTLCVDKDFRGQGIGTKASFISNCKRIILGVGLVTAHELNEHISKNSYKRLVNKYQDLINKICN